MIQHQNKLLSRNANQISHQSGRCLPIKSVYVIIENDQQADNIYLQNSSVTRMKPQMRAPAVSEIYQQKLVYQYHLRKLDKIREERKNQLAYDSSRYSKFDEIRHSKSRSFAHRYNEHHHEITQSNIKLLNKLEKVKPFARHTSYSTYERDEREQQAMTPLRKKRIAETEKENARIYNRMKSVSSSLSKNKLLKDYAKSQQIRTRITRYATQDNKVYLKSQVFANPGSAEKINLVAHYNPKDIINNKIDNRMKELKNKEQEVHNQTQKLASEREKQQSGRFFPTEPEKVKNVNNRRKIHI